jgi:hypothetical protein
MAAEVTYWLVSEQHDFLHLVFGIALVASYCMALRYCN